eukprot:gene9115-biopygen16703
MQVGSTEGRRGGPRNQRIIMAQRTRFLCGTAPAARRLAGLCILTLAERQNWLACAQNLRLARRAECENLFGLRLARAPKSGPRVPPPPPRRSPAAPGALQPTPRAAGPTRRSQNAPSQTRPHPPDFSPRPPTPFARELNRTCQRHWRDCGE